MAMPNIEVQLMHTSMSTIAAGTEAFYSVDTKGYDWLKIVVADGVPTASSTPDFFRIMHNDTAPSNYADGTALLTQGTDYTIGTSSTSFANSYIANIDLRGVDRFVGVGYESDATANGVIIALLGRKEDGGEQGTVATTAVGARNVLNL